MCSNGSNVLTVIKKSMASNSVGMMSSEKYNVTLFLSASGTPGSTFMSFVLDKIDLGKTVLNKNKIPQMSI